VFLLELNALQSSLTNRATFVIDPQTAPFHLLKGELPVFTTNTITLSARP